MDGFFLPTVNACFNTLSACLLALGIGFIRRKDVMKHRLCMTGAFIASCCFLIGYLTYHAQHGTTRYEGQGLIRTAYFSILWTHTVLAVVVVPMVVRTFYLALKERWVAHKALARWTFPVWMYVSVTGVVIYTILYHF